MEEKLIMASFYVQYETTTKAGVKSGLVGTSVTANTTSEARNKVKAQHPTLSVRIISVVKR